jgi:hypothetical protein
MGDVAEHAALLAGIFQNKGSNLRAVHIRKADKSLLALEAVFTPEFTAECATWRRGVDARRVLEDKLVLIDVHQARLDALRERITALDESIARWMALPQGERNKISLQARRAAQYFEAKVFQAESHILHRYERFQALKGLAPYADNAHFLCEAIHHFENREKYEDNKFRLEKRREGALERWRSVNRGFWLAVAFCALLVTIPLCAPFAWSLYRRKKEVENQIANLEETLRREDKRIQSADEGVVAAQEIREVLGPVPLEQVRSTLGEVSELRREFQSAGSGASITASLIAFLELHADQLEALFGAAPRSTMERFRWLTSKVDEMTGAERDKERVAIEDASERDKLRRILKGHSADLVRQGLENLRKVTHEALSFTADETLKREIAAMGVRLPRLFDDVRRTLWHVSHGQSVDEVVWKRLAVALASESNLLNACALELRLGAPPAESGTHGTSAGSESSRAVV